ncbi:pescadillo homolog isoform X6 [Acanthopagrus latus]|uniref:pescadillo homolog isoform X6 n=1 Tax=Acanthopagrus latus TaxID=8177 RepID=UPI00187C5E11|nr:pescadillo homolog isoform X6 [Acanthopagrus latus]
MRFLVPLFVFLAVAAFHSALSASLESAEKEDVVAKHDGLSELQKIDQMEFEAAQKSEAAQMNVTEEQSEDGRYLEAVQYGSVEERVEAEDDSKAPAEGGGSSDVAAQKESECESSEEADEHHEAKAETVSSSVDEVTQDSTKEQGEQMLHKHHKDPHLRLSVASPVPAEARCGELF